MWITLADSASPLATNTQTNTTCVSLPLIFDFGSSPGWNRRTITGRSMQGTYPTVETDLREARVRGTVPVEFLPPVRTPAVETRLMSNICIVKTSATIPKTPSCYTSISTVSSSSSSTSRTGATTFGLLAGGPVATDNRSRSGVFLGWLKGKMRMILITDQVVLHESWYLM